MANYLGENESFNPLGISSYKMNYFLPFAYSFNSLGTNNNKSEAKFQLSVKKTFENLLGLDEKYYIAYTQTSWWQIMSILLLLEKPTINQDFYRFSFVS